MVRVVQILARAALVCGRRQALLGASVVQLLPPASVSFQTRLFAKQQRPPSASSNSPVDLHFQQRRRTNNEDRGSGRTPPRPNGRDARTQLWMEGCVAANDYLSILRAVAECYAPLFRAHPALAGTSCALAELVAQQSSSSDPALPDNRGPATGPQQAFREGHTKQTEQLALDVLFKSGQPELVAAVYENWQAVHAAIASAEPLAERVPTVHFRSFFSLACGAYSALHRHEQVVGVYKAAVAAKRWPTVAMNINYVHALTSLRRYDDVAAAYASIQAADGVQNVFFYRCMLFYAGVAGDVAVLSSVRATMRDLRFALRPVDVAHSIRAYDRECFTALPVASYVELCAATDADAIGTKTTADTTGDTTADTAADTTERLATAVDGARSVLAFFDEFVANSTSGSVVVSNDVGKTLYARVLAAAIVAGTVGNDTSALDRVRTVVQTRRARGNAPFTEEALQVAVTGLLLSDDPHDAWRLVQEELEHASLRPRALSAVVSNILAYLCAARTEAATQLLLRVLDDLALRRQTAATAVSVVANPQVRAVIDALCADTAGVLDEQQLLTVIAAHDVVFRVRDQPFWFAYFLASCRTHARFVAAKSTFFARNTAAVPTIPADLALACIESYAAREDFEFVFRLALAANAQRCSPSEKRALGNWAVRACGHVDWLGADDIRVVAASFLQDVPRNELSADVQALLAQVEVEVEG